MWTQAGGNKPIVTGTVTGGYGGRAGGSLAQRSISYQPTGTTVTSTPRVGAENAVAVDLQVEETRVKPPAEGEEVGAAIETTSTTTRVNVPPGRAVVAKSHRVDGKAGPTYSLLIVTATATGR